MLSRISDQVALLVTIVALVLTVLTCLCYATILLNPHVPLNPFPPPRGVAGASPTATKTVPAGPTFPPTWTPTYTATPTDTPPPTDTPTITPTFTNTPTPTFTPAPTATPRPPAPPTATHTPSPTPTPWPYVLEAMTAKANDLNEAGCAWLGAAGRITGAGVQEIQAGIGVRVSSDGWSMTSAFGSTSVYGSPGWEVYLDDHPKNAAWRAQVVDATGSPLSEPVGFQTIDNCFTNLTVVDFRKTGAD
jgi:hypothetical protein